MKLGFYVDRNGEIYEFVREYLWEDMYYYYLYDGCWEIEIFERENIVFKILKSMEYLGSRYEIC